MTEEEQLEFALRMSMAAIADESELAFDIPLTQKLHCCMK